MKSDLVIQMVLSSFDGEFNRGLIRNKSARSSDCFAYYVYGSADYIFEDQTLSVREGDAFYLAKGSVYDIQIHEKSKFICLNFDFQPSDTVRHSELFPSVGTATGHMFHQFLHLRLDEDRDYLPKAFSALYDVYFELLMIGNQASARYVAGFDRLHAYIIDHYADSDLSLASIANGTDISESRIRRMLQSKLHTTPIKYINSLRLEKAQALLSESNVPISDIAYATGFEDPFYFSRMFKKQYGISPARYRALHGCE